MVGVHGIAGCDDHTPASPDGTGSHQSSVLGKREFLSGTSKVGDTGEDDSPLTDNISFRSL